MEDVMKHLTYIILFISISLTAQEKRYTQFSVAVLGGANAPVTRGSNITDERDLSFKTLGVDFRYMMDKTKGIQLSSSMNKRTRSDQHLVHHNMTLEGVYNITQAVYSWYQSNDWVSIFAHGGIGASRYVLDAKIQVEQNDTITSYSDCAP